MGKPKIDIIVILGIVIAVILVIENDEKLKSRALLSCETFNSAQDRLFFNDRTTTLDRCGSRRMLAACGAHASHNDR